MLSRFTFRPGRESAGGQGEPCSLFGRHSTSFGPHALEVDVTEGEPQLRELVLVVGRVVPEREPCLVGAALGGSPDSCGELHASFVRGKRTEMRRHQSVPKMSPIWAWVVSACSSWARACSSFPAWRRKSASMTCESAHCATFPLSFHARVASSMSRIASLWCLLCHSIAATP